MEAVQQVPAPSSPCIGDVVFGCFRLLDTIGAGSFATAYLAKQLGTDRLAVVKIPHAHMLSGPNGPELRRRFAAEARASTRVDHPNLVTVFLVGDTRYGLPAIAMEYIRGTTVQDRLTRAAPLSFEELAALGEQLADVLTTLHEADIVHRDISPSNVLIQPRTNSPVWVKLLDLGVAKLLDAPSRTLGPMGTPGYVAPEQLLGAVTPQTDLYSLGALLWWAITGSERPDDIHDGSLRRNIGSTVGPDPRMIRPSAPAGFAELIASALIPEPSARPTTADFLARWREVAERDQPRAPRVRLVPPPLPGTHSSPRDPSSATKLHSPRPTPPTPPPSPLPTPTPTPPPTPTPNPNPISSPKPPTASALAPRVGNANIAVVMSNPVLRAQVTSYLRDRASVETLDARELGRAAPGRYAVAILGEQLPQVGTLGVVEHLQRCYPGLSVIVAGHDSAKRDAWIDAGAGVFIQLPAELDALDSWIQAGVPTRTPRAARLSASVIEPMRASSPEQLLRTLEAFIGCVPQWIAELEQDLEDPDSPGARRVCQQLIGGSEAVGAAALARLARAACQSLSSGDAPTAKTFLAAAELEYREVFREAFTLMNQLRASETSP